MDRIDRLTKKVKQGGKTAQAVIDIVFLTPQENGTWELNVQMQNSKQGYFDLDSVHNSEEAANAELDRIIAEYQISQQEIHILTEADSLEEGLED